MFSVIEAAAETCGCVSVNLSMIVCLGLSKQTL